MRRRIAVVLVGVLGIGAIGTGAYSAIALGLPIPATAATVETPVLATGPAVAPAPPDYGASGIGAVGWDAPLVVAGDPAPHPIASISKVVTALVVLDRLPIDSGDGPTRTLTAQDSGYYDAAVQDEESRAPAPEGSVITERDALEAMLVSSSSNHARTLADWAFGSQAEFATAAADWLAAHGLTGTTIVEPSGADPRNASTIPDLIRIGELALQNPTIAAIVSERTADIPDVGQIENSNALLGVSGIDGIKTGTLAEAGACLLFSADVPVGSQTVTVVGAVLGGPDHGTVNASVQALLASVSAGFQEVAAVTPGTAFGDYETAWDASAHAVASEDATFLVWGPEPVTVDVELEPVTVAPAGEKVGTATVSTPRRTIEVPLVLDAAIPDPGAGWRWTHPSR